jgi:serine/threonine protein kinase
VEEILANLGQANIHQVNTSTSTISEPPVVTTSVGTDASTNDVLQHFSLAQLSAATNSFHESNILGRKGYGSVYKGELYGTAVAVKVLAAESVQGIAQFEREVRVLSQIQHPHIARLIGYCAEKTCLVYEVMSGGSLEDVLGSR